jgi:general stress protein 26
MSETSADHVSRIWDLIERADVCMMTTQFAGGLRARPLEPRPDREAGLIRFVTDRRSEKQQEIAALHDVGLIFINDDEKAYLSISGHARSLDDHAEAAEIWRKGDGLWWHGPYDPNVCVLEVTPVLAELWDGPASKAVATYEFRRALITGARPNLGENRKVTVTMR